MSKNLISWENATNMFLDIYDSPGHYNIISIETYLNEIICFNPKENKISIPDFRFLDVVKTEDYNITSYGRKVMSNKVIDTFCKKSTLYLAKNENTTDSLSLVVVINILKFAEIENIHILFEPPYPLKDHHGRLRDYSFIFDIEIKEHYFYHFSMDQMEFRQMMRHYLEYLGAERYGEIRGKCYKALKEYKEYMKTVNEMRDAVEKAFSFKDEEKLLFEVNNE